ETTEDYSSAHTVEEDVTQSSSQTFIEESTTRFSPLPGQTTHDSTISTATTGEPGTGTAITITTTATPTTTITTTTSSTTTPAIPQTTTTTPTTTTASSGVNINSYHALLAVGIIILVTPIKLLM
ncbi:unnamed protein product, partial [Didymodactylos carnosus]